jgi:ribosomal protein L7/L12
MALIEGRITTDHVGAVLGLINDKAKKIKAKLKEHGANVTD